MSDDGEPSRFDARIDAACLRGTMREIVFSEFRNIGIFAEDDDDLRAIRLNFDWVDRQRRSDPDLQELLAWVREEKRRSEEDRRRTEENRSEVRKAFLGKAAEWVWHVISAAIAGGVTYFFSTRGHS